MATLLETRHGTLYAELTGERAATLSTTAHAYACVFAALCVMVGVYWDISWHMSIGRDSFWTPAHLVIQAGGLIAGLSSGYVALKTTFAGTEAERNAAVSFWGFRAPLGAWICIWGCGAMLTSAPFDNWWHNAYGLDVKIISPPHTILAIGIFAIVTGALLLTLAEQNRASVERQKKLAWLLAAVAGMFIMNYALFLTEYSERRVMHSGWFYGLTSAVFPFGLAAMSRAIKLKWAATAAALSYTILMLGLMWIIGLFPATPKLGPIYQHITHMVTLSFPLLIIVPAICFDLVMQRLDGRVSDAALAPILGGTFLVAFMAAQWPFAAFLMTPAARGRFFNPENYVYWMGSAYEALQNHFDVAPRDAWPFGVHLLIALGLGTVMSFLGLSRGNWMRQVRR
jgi:hypothetical protein